MTVPTSLHAANTEYENMFRFVLLHFIRRQRDVGRIVFK
jgi:hypothetical protein